METTLENCVGIRLVVDEISPLHVRSLERGLICIGAGLKYNMLPVVAVCDALDSMGGLTAIEAAGGVFAFLEHSWHLRMAVRKSNLVVLDQAGIWSHVKVSWGRDCRVDWMSPVRWPDSEVGSEEAFRGVFGEQANRVLGVMEEIVGGDHMRFGYIPNISTGGWKRDIS